MIIDYLKLIDEYAICKMSKKKLYKNFADNPAAFRKYAGDINKAEKLRHNLISDRNLEVVYFTGASGSGKTTLAKYFAMKLNYDFFVSGSGDDIFDNYDKEECIILDDWRAGNMRFSEILKMLDNNTNSSIKSRYNNKDISNCKLIILTSVINPFDLYKVLKDTENDEPIEQFYRRLRHHYFKIDSDDCIREYNLKINDTSPTGKCLGYMKDVYEELGINPAKVDDTSLLDIFKKDDTNQKDLDIF